MLNKVEINKDCPEELPPQPLPEPINKVEIKKSSCEDNDKISVEFKKEPVPDDVEKDLNKQIINFDNKPKYKGAVDPILAPVSLPTPSF